MPTSRRSPAIPFIERICGLELRQFQRDFLTELLREENGQRVYTAALWGLPRGNGKSEVAAAVALAMLTIDGRPHREDRNPALVVIAAGSREQAAIPFKAARRMIRSSPTLDSHLHVLPGRKVITFPEQDGELHIISREAPLQHGLRPTAVIFDEVWNQPDRELWDAMVGGLIKVHDPLFLCISTAGWDSTSLLADLCKKGETGADPRFLYRWHGLPQDSDLDYRDPKTWRTANPAMDCEKPFLSESGVRDSLERMHEAEFRRWHLNQWTRAESQWLPSGAWPACEAPKEPTGQIVLAFCGTYSGDSAALVGATASGHVFVVDAWESDSELGVDRTNVGAGVAKAMNRYSPWRLVCNLNGWKTEIQDWTDKWGSSVAVMDWSHEAKKRESACSRFYSAVIGGQVTHDGDVRLAQHLSAAHVKQTPEGFYISKGGAGSGRKVELAVAAVMAYDFADAQSPEPLVVWA